MSAPVFVLALGPGRLPDRAIGVRLHPGQLAPAQGARDIAGHEFA